MAAMSVEQANPPALVPEEHQILPKDTYRDWQVLEFGRHRHRLPKTAEVFSARRVRPYAGQFRVFGRNVTLMIAAVGLADGFLAAGRSCDVPGGNRNGVVG